MSILAENFTMRFKEAITQIGQRGPSTILKKWSSNLKSNPMGGASSQGFVFLIGAGPGAADLLTLKAYRALQNADVILYDALVSDEVVALFPTKPERIYVGKRFAQHSMSQEDITALMLKLALEGKQVVRVKGGDPAIFARVGEECQALHKAGIQFCVVPGVTAASGASSYAGIPLTHRACAQSVRFVTAHLKDAESEPDWASMVPNAQCKHGETLVFYMGLRRIQQICDRLTAHGMDPNMPVAVIEHATHQEQNVCIGTLKDIAEQVQIQQIKGPAITIVGRVVEYRYALTQVAQNADAELLAI